jgi:hypothetical protein
LAFNFFKDSVCFRMKTIIQVIKWIYFDREFSTVEDFIKIWFHEMRRIFHDQLNTFQFRQWFHHIIQEVISKSFQEMKINIDIHLMLSLILFFHPKKYSTLKYNQRSNI